MEEQKADCEQLPVEEMQEEKKQGNKLKNALLNKLNPKKVKKILIIVLVVTFLGVGTWFFLDSRSPEKIAVKYAHATLMEDAKTLQKIQAYDYYTYLMDKYENEDAFFEAQSDKYGKDIRSWNDYNKAAKKYKLEDMEYQYGKFKVDYTVTKVRKMTPKHLEEVLGKYYDAFESWGLDREKIKKGMEITVRRKFESEEANAKQTFVVHLAQIGGSWKALLIQGE